jgi:hypothetical protein
LLRSSIAVAQDLAAATDYAASGSGPGSRTVARIRRLRPSLGWLAVRGWRTMYYRTRVHRPILLLLPRYLTVTA